MNSLSKLWLMIHKGKSKILKVDSMNKPPNKQEGEAREEVVDKLGGTDADIKVWIRKSFLKASHSVEKGLRIPELPRNTSTKTRNFDSLVKSVV